MGGPALVGESNYPTIPTRRMSIDGNTIEHAISGLGYAVLFPTGVGSGDIEHVELLNDQGVGVWKGNP